MKHPDSRTYNCKHPVSLLLCAVLAFPAIVLISTDLSARSRSASIRATASVEEPLGITEVSSLPGSYMFAPRNTTAYVLVENHSSAGSEIQYSTILQANDYGLIEIDNLNNKLQAYSSAQHPSFVTVILTEN